MTLRAEENTFVVALVKFRKAGASPERIFELIAETMGQEFISAAGRMMRAYQLSEGIALHGSNFPPPQPVRAKFDPEKQRVVVENIKKAVVKNFLCRIMPNDKELRDCTGNDCRRMGGWLTKIAERVKPTQKVGNALTEEEIQALMAKAA